MTPRTNKKRTWILTGAILWTHTGARKLNIIVAQNVIKVYVCEDVHFATIYMYTFVSFCWVFMLYDQTDEHVCSLGVSLGHSSRSGAAKYPVHIAALP